MDNSKLLNGNSVTYQYAELGTVKVEFYDGRLKYEWIEGDFTGAKGENFQYNCKELEKGLYMISWFEKPKYSFITVVLNFNKNEVQSSALLNGTTEMEMTLFHSAIIKSHTLAFNN
jgi:hypothetical protein